MAKERLDKLLARKGFGSRKDVKKILRTQEVFVNHKQIFDSSFLIDPENDEISVNGEKIIFEKNLYLMMNKAANYVCSTKDGEHQTVFDLLDDELRTPYLQEKLHIIGRLDLDTEGLLIFTTDGTLTHRLISPKSHIGKTYYCELEKPESEERQKEIFKKFSEGFEISPEGNESGFFCKSAELVWLDNSKAELTIYEGKYHQVKRMFGEIGNKIVYLKRISIGNLKLDENLSAGKYRSLTQEELALLG